MYSLLIDSHGQALNIVLYKDHEVCLNENIIFNNQSKIIVPKILDVIKEENISFNDITEIIVVNGPGSFTGVRLGVTIAKTMAYSLNIPIKSISTIKLMAINVNKDNNYIIAIPDQKGYFIGEFDNNNHLQKDYYYISKAEFENIKITKDVIENIDVDWNNVYKFDCLNDEDCFNIKPLYIKKIEVEK